MPNKSAQPMPVLVAVGLFAIGLALLLVGMSMETPAGAGLVSGGIGMMIVTVMFAVAGRLRK